MRTARVGRRAPSPPRRDRHRRARSAQPASWSGSGGCSSPTPRSIDRSRATASPTEKYARDLPPDRLDRWFFDHAFLGLGIGITILCLTLGWSTGSARRRVHAVAYLGLSGAINAVGHTMGSRPARELRRRTSSRSRSSPRARGSTTTTMPPRRRRGSAFRRSEIDLGLVGDPGRSSAFRLVHVRHSEPKIVAARS